MSKSKSDGVGIYLHWDGEVEYVQALLDLAKSRGYRNPAYDPEYALARLVGLIHESTGIGNSAGVGVGLLRDMATDLDNGVYVVGDDWSIVDRWG